METWRDALGKERLETRFGDFKPAFSRIEAETEASRCINCHDAACIQACPTKINIPQFISRIASGNVRGAAKTILEANVFGLSCASSCPTEVLCEGACVYNDLDKKPIRIGRLQRFATETAYQSDWRFFEAGKPTGKKVALIGAGPASLACAHELRRQGHDVVVFEKSQLPGGLNTHGIAPYKMRAPTSLAEIEKVTSIGIPIQYGKELGKDVALADLLREYQAVFLGIGLGPDSRLDLPGADHPRVLGAVEFISKLKVSRSTELSWLGSVKTAVVIGGGNTALDACRELRGLGVEKVIVSYRRGEKEMSGYAHELSHAKEEGVEFAFQTLPSQIERTGEVKLRMRLQKTRIGADGQVTLLETHQDLDAELVLLATGQSKLEKLLSGISELQFEKGRLKTDPVTGRTGHPRIFAGGDLANGGMEVVNAVAEGKKAASAIHEVLSHG